MKGEGGNAIDISWAVDAQGNYVGLDSIHFVKIMSASFKEVGHLGEISTDVAFISDVVENSTISGKTNMLVIYYHDPELLVGDSVMVSGKHFELGKPTGKPLNYAIKSGDGTLSDEHFVKSTKGGEVIIVVNLGEDANQSEETSVYFREPVAIQLNTDLSALYPGDTLLLDVSVLDQDDPGYKKLITFT